ncbi:MAG: hypothetical protein CMI26_13295 [Opitutae bacterium]|nr:hypothetical protein [Opitutae bacterium]
MAVERRKKKLARGEKDVPIEKSLVPMGWGFRFRRKVMLSTFAAVCFGMVLAAVSFVTVDVSATRSLIRENLNSRAESMAHNLKTALQFNDKTSVYEDLNRLREQTNIIRAAVYKSQTAAGSKTTEQEFLVGYERGKKSNRFPNIEKATADFWGDKSTWVVRPISQNNIEIGAIFLERTLADVDNRFKRYAGMAFGVAGIGVFVTMLGALWFQSSLTRPIFELSSKANEVALNKDFSVRARKFSEDELGDLTDVFNDMLSTVDEANRILKESNEEMEQRVERRTEQLTQANQNLVEEAKERAFAEEKLLDANRRLNVQERLAAVGQVSANIAHEIRNPLSAIRQSVYFLDKMVHDRYENGRQPKEEKIRKHLDLIESELAHSDNVIDGLLGMSRGKKLNIISFDLVALVKEVADYCRLNENISFVNNFTESQFFIFADSTLFRQVFINLFRNAEQAMPNGGTITISGMNSPKGETVILLSDTGCGLDESEQTKVFDTLHTTKAGGAGLGLNLCRDILQRHDGTISMINNYKKHSWLRRNWTQGNGARILITLPHQIHDGKNLKNT